MSKINRKPSKVYLVPIPMMRVPPALVTQRQFRPAHGNRIAAELDLDQLGFPIVNLRDGIYWILDGQHRIYALRQKDYGEYQIECEVYENLTDQEMARIFLGRDDRKQVAPYDKFHVSVTAGYTREQGILRAVESNGQKISRDRREGISTVGALGAVYDRSGEVVLGQVIRCINLSFSGDELAFDRSIVEGLGQVFNRFNGKTNEKALATRLSNLRHGARELLQKAEQLRERTGNQKKHCVSAAIVDIYNKPEAPTSKNRLPNWWKETV
jgi:hypothetical protein